MILCNQDIFIAIIYDNVIYKSQLHKKSSNTLHDACKMHYFTSTSFKIQEKTLVRS